MASPTPVNSQITDAVTQVDTKVEGESPATALGSDNATGNEQHADNASAEDTTKNDPE